MTSAVAVPSRQSLRAFWAMGLLLVALVVVACLVPARNLPGTGINDKVEHGLAFMVMALWFAGLTARRDYLYLLLALVALGGGIEIAQGLMGLGRNADPMDLLADSVGALAGLALALTPLGRWVDVMERHVLQRIWRRRA